MYMPSTEASIWVHDGPIRTAKEMTTSKPCMACVVLGLEKILCEGVVFLLTRAANDVWPYTNFNPTLCLFRLSQIVDYFAKEELCSLTFVPVYGVYGLCMAPV